MSTPISTSLNLPSPQLSRCGVSNLLMRIDRVSQLIVIADVQGNLKPTEAALVKAGVINSFGDWCAPSGTAVVFLGDLIDGGPDGKGCLDLAIKLNRQAAVKGGCCETIMGNHEHWMVDALQEPEARHLWLSEGGLSTFQSFGFKVESVRQAKTLLDDAKCAQRFEPYVAWLYARPLAGLVNDHSLLVHAGPDFSALSFDDFCRSILDDNVPDLTKIQAISESRSWLPVPGFKQQKPFIESPSLSNQLHEARVFAARSDISVKAAWKIIRRYSQESGEKEISNHTREIQLTETLQRLKVERMFFGHTAQLHLWYGIGEQKFSQGHPYSPFPTIPATGLNVLPRAGDTMHAVQVAAVVSYDKHGKEQSCRIISAHAGNVSFLAHSVRFDETALPRGFRSRQESKQTPAAQASIPAIPPIKLRVLDRSATRALEPLYEESFFGELLTYDQGTLKRSLDTQPTAQRKEQLVIYADKKNFWVEPLIDGTLEINRTEQEGKAIGTIHSTGSSDIAIAIMDSDYTIIAESALHELHGRIYVLEIDR